MKTLATIEIHGMVFEYAIDYDGWLCSRVEGEHPWQRAGFRKQPVRFYTRWLAQEVKHGVGRLVSSSEEFDAALAEQD